MIRGLSRWMSTAVFVVVVLAIWKANNGDVSTIVNSVWGLLNKGADIVISLWNSFTSIGGSAGGGADPAVTPSP